MLLHTIDTQDEWDAFIDKIEGVPFVYPVYSDPKRHPSQNSVACLFIAGSSDIVACILVDHVEKVWERSDIRLLEALPRFVVEDSKTFRYFYDEDNMKDYRMLRFFKTNEAPTKDEQTYTRSFKARVPVSHIRKAIPHVKLYESLQEHIREAYLYTQENEDLLSVAAYEAYVKDVLSSLWEIEREGLYVHEDYRDGQFPNGKKAKIYDNKVYTSYNIYTSTGRPSNAWQKINYAALQPEERKPYSSRFGKDGVLLLIDYDAFHLRLLATLMDYELPDESFHEHLARIYFEEEGEISQEQYEESKKISFTLLYHPTDIPDELIEGNPYFQRAQEFTQRLWKGVDKTGSIITPIYRRRIRTRDMGRVNPSKALNYLLQSYETEWNVKTLLRLQEYLHDRHSVISLYTYDSLLIDFSREDGPDTMREIISIMERGGMKVKTKAGKTYANMKLITDF